MQDYNYWRYGCYEITLEISCCKYPSASKLQEIWLENQKPLLQYLKIANTGVRGIVTFFNGQPASFLTVSIASREPYFKTNSFGEYYRILLPGTYSIQLMINCTTIYKSSITITKDNGGLLVFNITLTDPSLYESYRSALSGLNRYSVFCSSNMQPASCTNRNSNVNVNSARGLKIFGTLYLTQIVYFLTIKKLL